MTSESCIAGQHMLVRRRHLPPNKQQLKALQLSARVAKYWMQRYSLWARYDAGVRMDEEGWFSATPEVIALHHAGEKVTQQRSPSQAWTRRAGSARPRRSSRCTTQMTSDSEPVIKTSHGPLLQNTHSRDAQCCYLGSGPSS